MKKISTQIQTRWDDFDVLGHLFNGNFSVYFDVCICELFKQVLEIDISSTLRMKAQAHDALFPIKVSSHIDFQSEVPVGSSVEVQSWVESVGNKSIHIHARMLIDGGMQVAVARTVMVCVDLHSKESELIPERWRERIAEHFDVR